MIGGIDYVVSYDSISLKLIERMWPFAVVEDVNGDRIAIENCAFIPRMTELFIYKNMKIAMKWEELGAEPELVDTMIHIIARNEEVTIVVDTPDLFELIKETHDEEHLNKLAEIGKFHPSKRLKKDNIFAARWAVLEIEHLRKLVEAMKYPLTPEGQVANPAFKGNGRLE